VVDVVQLWLAEVTLVAVIAQAEKYFLLMSTSDYVFLLHFLFNIA
jgi:hypothetical protein